MTTSKLSPEERAEGARSFSRALEGLADGKAMHEASEEFWGLLRDISLMAKSRGPDGEAAGSMDLKLKVMVNAKGEADIGYDITTKKPKKKRLTAVAWLTKGGNLTFEVPRQLGLPNVTLVEKPATSLEDNPDGELLSANSDD